jgi:ERF superfamily
MSSSSLRARAAAAADPAATWPTPAEPGSATPEQREPAPEALEPVDAPEGQDDDPPVVPVQVAVARVMRDIGTIGKADRFDGNGTRYNFRGIDRVVNAVGPVLRKHGVLVVPELVSTDYRDVARANGGRSHECLVVMRYRWIGPAGDEIVATVAGENLDTSDKSTSKAQSVAWRTCLIQMLAIPTGDPDPDSIRIERGEQPLPKATDYRDEIVNPRTSLGRLKQIRGELATHRLGETLVENEVGGDEPLGALLQRIGRARQDGA